jgi:hypothetical protein
VRLQRYSMVGKRANKFSVMAGLDPAIPIRRALRA